MSFVTGALAIIGIAAIGWALVSRMRRENIDPLSEADRRINELEHSLHRLQDTYSRASRP